MDDLQLALALADDADALTMARFRALDLHVERKPDLTPVTDADRDVERALRDRLGKERPGEAVAGEEYGVEEGDVRWWLDPIDGTKQYARGLPIWATLIALDRDGETVCGVVSAPALGHRWWATRGESAFRDGEAIRVSNVATLADAYVSTTTFREAQRFAPVSSRAYVARTYTDFWQYVLVAEGSIDLAVEFFLHDWDWKAPKLIVEEAGGRYTVEPDLYLASNGPLHDEAALLLRA